MRREELRIRKRLLELELKQVDIARYLGVTPEAVSKVIRGKGRSRRIEAILQDKEKLQEIKEQAK